MISPIVSLRNVSRRFAGDVFALRDVSLEIARGELVMIDGLEVLGVVFRLHGLGLDRVVKGGDVALVREVRIDTSSESRRAGSGCALVRARLIFGWRSQVRLTIARRRRSVNAGDCHSEHLASRPVAWRPAREYTGRRWKHFDSATTS